MAYEQRELSGSIFVNDRKEKDSHPDFKGQCLIDGKSYWVSGWKKKTGEGKTWLSLAFKEKDAAPKQETGGDAFSDAHEEMDRASRKASNSPAPIDDSIPF